MAKLVIIADDLTGALDTGVQFSKKNMSVAVITDLDNNFENNFKDTEVIVIDTESRHISEKEAKERVKSAVSKFSREKTEFFYKKMDSTLRGNIGSETEGFMEGLGIDEISFIPAFPSGKRTVKNGILYVDGIELEKTQFAKDILNPVTDSFIPDIIKKQTEIKVERQDFAKLNPKADENEKRINLFDCETVEHMELIAETLQKNNLLNYTMGNAGFAEILGNYIKSSNNREDVKIESDKVLFVCGSVNITSLNQCRQAEKIGYTSETLNFKDIISETYKQSAKFSIDKEYYKMKWNESQKLLIRTADTDDVIERAREYSKENNILMETLTLNIAENTGKLMSDIIKEKNIKNVIVFGGDTLMGILKSIECRYIVPVTEILPGVVFTRAVGKDITVNVITKAGGFGDENTITKIDNFIKINQK